MNAKLHIQEVGKISEGAGLEYDLAPFVVIKIITWEYIKKQQMSTVGNAKQKDGYTII